MSSPWTFLPSSSSARPSPISSILPPRQAERGTSLYSPATEPGGEGFCSPASGGSRANSACSGTPPTVPATAPSRTVARSGRVPPLRQLASPVRRGAWKRSLPASEPSARRRPTNCPDWRRSICSPRQAWPWVTS